MKCAGLVLANRAVNGMTIVSSTSTPAFRAACSRSDSVMSMRGARSGRDDPKWMWRKGRQHTGDIEPTGFAYCRSDHSLVAGMESVEHADRDDATSSCLRHDNPPSVEIDAGAPLLRQELSDKQIEPGGFLDLNPVAASSEHM